MVRDNNDAIASSDSIDKRDQSDSIDIIINLREKI
jgi:hypothetical protein